VQFQTAQVSSSNWYAQVTRTASDAGSTYQLDRIATLAAPLFAAGTPPTEDQLEAWREQFKFIDKSSLYDAEVQYRNEWGALKLVTGVGGRIYLPVSGGTYLADVGDTKLSAAEGGLYAQADYALLPDRLKVVAAARLDTHTNYAPQLSPKAALVYTVAENQNVRLTYNRAFKSPTILENYLLIGNSFLGNKTGFVIKDPSGAVLSEIPPLSPEQVDSLEVGYKGSLADRVFVDVVGYHSWYHNFISALTPRANGAATVAYYADTGAITAEGTPQQGQLLTYSNYGQAQVLGTDLGVDFQVLPEVALNGSVSFIRMYSFQKDPSSTLPNLLLNVPQFKARAGVTLQDLGLRNSFLRLTGRYQTAYQFASGRWISANFYPDGLIPARFVADIGLGYKFGNGLQLSANLYNILDDHGVDVLGAPAAGRFFFAQIEYAFSGLDH
jgi:iron complex outermembrane receptor protein